MGNGMNKVLPGIYLGSIRDAKDTLQLKENNITHILSIHENAKKLHADIECLCISACDSGDQDLSQYFSICNDFIHRSRISEGNILIHCLAGVSRSVTVTVAYIMTVTNYGWRDSLNIVRGSRKVANPNFGFQRQLLAFEHEKLPQERQKFKSKQPSPYDDQEIGKVLLEEHWRWVLEGDTPEENKDSNDPGRGLYPLPNKAYGSKQGKICADTTKCESNGVIPKDNNLSNCHLNKSDAHRSNANERGNSNGINESAGKEVVVSAISVKLTISSDTTQDLQAVTTKITESTAKSLENSSDKSSAKDEAESGSRKETSAESNPPLESNDLSLNHDVNAADVNTADVNAADVNVAAANVADVNVADVNAAAVNAAAVNAAYVNSAAVNAAAVNDLFASN